MCPEGAGSRVVRQTLRALRYRNFRLFFFGQLTSLVGSWMQSLAQGWLVWRLTRSPWLLGLLGFFQMIPVLAFGLVGGLAADRFSRYRIVLLTQSAMAMQATTLALLTLSGLITIPQVMVLAALLGIINAFDMPGRQAFLVEMVGKEDLGNAIALNSSIFNGARIIGPALAGFVVRFWGEGICFAINAVSFIAVLGGLLAMRVESPARASAGRSPLQELKEGIGYAWGTPHVRALLGLMTGTSLLALPYTALLPAVAGGLLGRGSEGLGVLMAGAGVGALAGALAMAYRQGVRGLGRIAGSTNVGFGAFLVLLATSRHFPLSVAVMTCLGFCMMVQLAATNTLLQSLVPERLRGRLMSFYTVTFIGMTPVGSLIQGRLAILLGLRWTLALGGILTVFVGLVFLATVPRVRTSVTELMKGPGP